MLSLAFAIAIYVLTDLLFAGSASAKLGTVLLGLNATTFMLASIAIRLQRLRSC